jgi:hypothetical protein
MENIDTHFLFSFFLKPSMHSSSVMLPGDDDYSFAPGPLDRTFAAIFGITLFADRYFY